MCNGRSPVFNENDLIKYTFTHTRGKLFGVCEFGSYTVFPRYVCNYFTHLAFWTSFWWRFSNLVQSPRMRFKNALEIYFKRLKKTNVYFLHAKWLNGEQFTIGFKFKHLLVMLYTKLKIYLGEIVTKNMEWNNVMAKLKFVWYNAFIFLTER